MMLEGYCTLTDGSLPAWIGIKLIPIHCCVPPCTAIAGFHCSLVSLVSLILRSISLAARPAQLLQRWQLRQCHLRISDCGRTSIRSLLLPSATPIGQSTIVRLRRNLLQRLIHSQYSQSEYKFLNYDPHPDIHCFSTRSLLCPNISLQNPPVTLCSLFKYLIDPADI